MRKSASSQLSPSQAQYVLDRLRQDRRVTVSEIGRYLADLQHEIQQLEERLGFLRELHHDSGAPARTRKAARRGRPAAKARAASSPGTRRRKRPVSAATAQSRKIQGVYLSLIRQIAKDKRPQFQKIAKETDREEAIRKMRAALK